MGDTEMGKATPIFKKSMVGKIEKIGMGRGYPAKEKNRPCAIEYAHKPNPAGIHKNLANFDANFESSFEMLKIYIRKYISLLKWSFLIKH